MATMDDAIALAERLAVERTAQTGRVWRGMVEEFEHGWCVWTQTPEDELPPLGGGAKTVLDRQTGRIAYYPGLPTEEVARRYAPGSANFVIWPPAPTRAQIDALLPGPARIAMIVSQDHGTFQAASARGDAEPEHHAWVAGWLAEQPAGRLVRGAARHADIMLLSVLFTAAEQLGMGTPEQVRDSVHGGVSSFRITNLYTQGRSRSLPCCPSCRAAWLHFGFEVPSVDELDERDVLVDRICAPPDPDRFSPRAARVLTAAGWDDRYVNPWEKSGWTIEKVQQSVGGGYDAAAAAAAREVGARYLLGSWGNMPGVECWVRPFNIGPSLERAVFDQLAAFGRRLGTPLFPVGDEEHFEAVLAVDARHRIFLLDQAGDWYYGAHIDEALAMIAEGRLPRRVRADGTVEGLD